MTVGPWGCLVLLFACTLHRHAMTQHRQKHIGFLLPLLCPILYPDGAFLLNWPSPRLSLAQDWRNPIFS